MIALAVAAAIHKETADEKAYESLACFRLPRLANSPRPISIAREAQLLTWVALLVGRHIFP
jgi:hypothetical protein